MKLPKKRLHHALVRARCMPHLPGEFFLIFKVHPVGLSPGELVEREPGLQHENGRLVQLAQISRTDYRGRVLTEQSLMHR